MFCFPLPLTCQHPGVDFTGSQNDRDDYCLEQGNDDYCYNACAIPYGADFTLVNYWRNPDGNIHYDPWFDENNKVFEHTTRSVLGKAPETMDLPSQYGTNPIPQHKPKTHIDNMTRIVSKSRPQDICWRHGGKTTRRPMAAI